MQKEANQLGIGKFSGEKLVNASRSEGGNTADTVKEEFKNVWKKYDKTLQEQEKREKFTEMQLIQKVRSGKTLEEMEASSPLLLSNQFFADLQRDFKECKLNGEPLYVSPKENFSSLTQSEKEEAQKKAYMDSLYDFCDKLRDRFTGTGFLNISALLVQTLTADLVIHLQKFSVQNGEPNPEFDTDKTVTISAGKGLKRLYEIREEGDQVHIVFNQMYFAKPNKITPERPEPPILGYITAQREIVIPRKELLKDWRVVDVKDVAPETKVIDRYSPFCQTLEAAEYYLDSFQK